MSKQVSVSSTLNGLLQLRQLQRQHKQQQQQQKFFNILLRRSHQYQRHKQQHLLKRPFFHQSQQQQQHNKHNGEQQQHNDDYQRTFITKSLSNHNNNNHFGFIVPPNHKKEDEAMNQNEKKMDISDSRFRMSSSLSSSSQLLRPESSSLLLSNFSSSNSRFGDSFINSKQHQYHTSTKKEIIPIIGLLVVVGFVGNYSYRALQRMDDEQEEYIYQCKQYEKAKMKHDYYQNTNQASKKRNGQSQEDEHDGTTVVPTTTTTKTIAIDLGTVYTKLAVSYPFVQVMIGKEGDRTLFNGIQYDINNKGNDAEDVILARGRGAVERYYFENQNDDHDDMNTSNKVLLPFHYMSSASRSGGGEKSNHESHDDLITKCQQTVHDILTPALHDVLDRLQDDRETDDCMIRQVVTVPVSLSGIDNDDFSLYPTIFDAMMQDNNNKKIQEIAFVPDPVSTIWGAQMVNLLPDDDDHYNNNHINNKETPTTTMVIDVGGMITQLSVVQQDQILYGLAIPWGGETFIETIVQRLLLLNSSSSSQQQQNQNSTTSTTPILQSTDIRTLSALQYHCRNAIIELMSNKQSRVKIHIPYLFSNPNQHHYDTEVSREMIQQCISENVRYHLVPYLQQIQEQNQQEQQNDIATILSPHLPVPVDMVGLFTSLITNVLEQSQQTPLTINHVIIVGGGSKLQYVTDSIQQALQILMGPDNSIGKLSSKDTYSKIIIPPADDTNRTELNVLGAATFVPSSSSSSSSAADDYYNQYWRKK